MTKSTGSYQRTLFFAQLHGGKYRECREVTDSSGVRCWCCYRPLESLIPVFRLPSCPICSTKTSTHGKRFTTFFILKSPKIFVVWALSKHAISHELFTWGPIEIHNLPTLAFPWFEHCSTLLHASIIILLLTLFLKQRNLWRVSEAKSACRAERVRIEVMMAGWGEEEREGSRRQEEAGW